MSKEIISSDALLKTFTELVKTLSLKFNNEIDATREFNKLVNIIGRVETLERPIDKVSRFEHFPSAFYIPIHTNKPMGSFDITVSFGTSTDSYTYQILLPVDFTTNAVTLPVCKGITTNLRNVIESLKITVLNADSDSGFIEIEHVLKIDPETALPNLDINSCTFSNFEIKNIDALTEISTESIDDTMTDPGKTVLLPMYAITSFDDIPERDRIVRSSSIKDIQTLTEDEYKAIPDGEVLATTLYLTKEDDVI